MAVRLRDPTGETASVSRSRVEPLLSLEDRTVALMDIGKMRGVNFIDRLEELCTDRGTAIRRFKKPTNTRVAPRELIDEIDSTSNAVIVAVSDSCMTLASLTVRACRA